MASLLVVLRSIAVEQTGAVLFHRSDGRLLAALCERGYDVTGATAVAPPASSLLSGLYAVDTPVTSPRFAFVRLAVTDGTSTGLLHKMGNWLRTARSLWPLMQSCNAGVFFMPSPQGFLALVLARIRGVDSVVYYGGDWGADFSVGEPQSPASRIYSAAIRTIRRSLQGVAYRISPVILVRDTATYRQLSAWRSRVYQAAALGSYVPKGGFQRGDTCQEMKIVCLSVGTLAQFKGVPDAIQALRLLRDAGHVVEWWHAGEAQPGFVATVQRMVKELGLVGHVRLLGYLDTVQLLEVYRRADVFVHAARTEGMPRVLAEAMSQGLPVVATRVGGVSMVLEHERSALLVEPRNPASLAEAVARVISDGVLRRRLIANGRAWAVQELARDPVEQILSHLPNGKSATATP
jgi:hypothetical protein